MEMEYNKDNPLRCFFAFEGYNSQGLGLNRIKRDYPDFDWVCVGRSEVEASAIKAANVLFPESADKNYGDISLIDWSQVPDFDLFTMSSPCQDFSQAGKQAGGDEGSGTRSSLLWECRKAIAAKRPKYVLFENVPAILSKKFLPGFLKWQKEMEEYGYTNFVAKLNSKDFGVPQNRLRCFMVSILRTEADPNPNYNFPAPIPLTKCVEDYMEPAEDVGEEYYIDQERVTNKVLSDILDQPNVRAEMEQLYHDEWKERMADSD